MKVFNRFLMVALMMLALCVPASAGQYFIGSYAPMSYPLCPTGVWVSNGYYYGPTYGPCPYPVAYGYGGVDVGNSFWFGISSRGDRRFFSDHRDFDHRQFRKHRW